MISPFNMVTQYDIELGNHCIRTREYVKTLAQRVKLMNLYPDQLSDQFIQQLFNTSQLHDIGKVKIPLSILSKNGKLTDDEWAIMKTHTTRGAEILTEAKKKNSSLTGFFNTAIEIAESHHEHWDGSGYPKGLSGYKIPLSARIMAIGEVYDALTSRRYYKMSWTHESAVAEIVSKSGTQFDPILIEAFKYEADNFRLIAEKIV